MASEPDSVDQHADGTGDPQDGTTMIDRILIALGFTVLVIAALVATLLVLA